VNSSALPLHHCLGIGLLSFLLSHLHSQSAFDPLLIGNYRLVYGLPIMANPAVFMQLPIMVRKSLYPDLDKDGMYIKEVPGDGTLPTPPRNLSQSTDQRP
jgi:hypothetical protein